MAKYAFGHTLRYQYYAHYAHYGLCALTNENGAA
jgi:hypothetical protein